MKEMVSVPAPPGAQLIAGASREPLSVKSGTAAASSMVAPLAIAPPTITSFTVWSRQARNTVPLPSEVTAGAVSGPVRSASVIGPPIGTQTTPG